MKGKEQTLKGEKGVTNYKLESQDLNHKHSQKGITLVALIVTIIVLLILAGITIMTLFGENGLINMVQKAKKENESAAEEERIQIAISDAVINNNGKLSKTELIKSLEKELASEDIEVTEGKRYLIIHYKKSDTYYKIYDDGNMSKLENYVNSLAYFIDNGEILVGDYFDYKITDYKNNGIYTVKPDISGYETEQEFDVKQYNGLYKVLYNGTEGYGIQIISEDNVLGNNKKLGLKGFIGYDNLVMVLNSMAGNYVDSKYALSARGVGSLPTDTQDSIGNTKTVRDERPNYSGPWGLPQAQSFKLNDYNYLTDYNQLKLCKLTNKRAFLASRRLGVGYHLGHEANLGVRTIAEPDAILELAWLNKNGVSNGNLTCGSGFMPVIKLNESIQVYKVEKDNKTIWKIQTSACTN